MKCPNCNKEVSELDEKCSKCGLVFDEYEEKNESVETENERESKTSLLKFINTVQLIGCIIGTIYCWANENVAFGFILLFGGIISYAFIHGFTDIIDLLDNINNKLDK